ncbi:MAG: hypothetical protein IJR85_10145 [Synergistaceae bacterium]|nr:hypothetical protein [Synergistaceae bacterium]
MIHEVLSRVEPNVEIFRDVCYEWEQELAKYFSVPIRQVFIVHNPLHDSFGRFLPARVVQKTRQVIKRLYIESVHGSLNQDISKPLSVYFCMFVPEINLCVGENPLPIFIDVSPDKEIDLLISSTRNLRIFYVTSRYIFDIIKEKSPASGVRYMPLSVADTYHSQNFAQYRHKSLDVIQMGRKNPVLHEYMLRYTQEHKDADYVYSAQGSINGNVYVSTKRGKIGTIVDRKSFIDFLASAKVSLVSSPNYDVKGINVPPLYYPTPRFYESAILGCALIGRYPDNQEFTELNMRKYCPSITSYEHFCKALEHALAQTPEELYAQNRDFIINSLTSKRAEQIQHDLEVLTCGQNS